MKRVLITGRNSYIGNRLAAWLNLWPKDYQVDKVSLQAERWQDLDWSSYDSIIHVAGIAHNSSSKSLESLYYTVMIISRSRVRQYPIRVHLFANQVHPCF